MGISPTLMQRRTESQRRTSMRIECKATDLTALIDEAWTQDRACPECEGQNLTEDQMRCRDCDPDPDPEEGS